MQEKYPNLLRRYLAAVLDFCFILFLLWAISRAFISIGYKNEEIGGWPFLLPFLLYEPILSSRFATLGQLVFSFRVRKSSEIEKADIWQTIPRTILKYILGFISFITMPARQDRRALHDLITNTIVVNARNKKT